MQAKVKQSLVIFLVITSLYSSFLHWQATINIDMGAEAIERWETQLQPVQEKLAVKRGVIGYVADWDVPGIGYDAADLETEFILTQYALSPLILAKGAVAEWNVAILSKPAFDQWEHLNQGKFEVVPLKEHIYLLHWRGSP